MTVKKTALQAITLAKRHGADDARARVGSSDTTRVEWRDGKMERIRNSSRTSLDLEIFVDGRYSSNSTSDLRESALSSFVKDAVAMTRVLAPDPHRKLPPKSLCADGSVNVPGIYDEKGASADIEECKETARELEKAVRREAGAKGVASSNGQSTFVISERSIAMSNGSEDYERETSFSSVADVSVKEEGRTQPGWDYARARMLGDLPTPGEIGKEAAHRAISHMGSGPVSTGEYPFIIENKAGGRLISMFLTALRGSLIQQDKSWAKQRRGDKVGSGLLTIVDDPLYPGGVRSTAFDGEGLKSKTLPLFEGGVLKNFLLDTYYASKLEREPTTGGWSNLIFEKGDKDLSALMKEMGEGILITGFLGGNSNPATGDFSVGIRGLFIEKGKPEKAVAGMNLSGNHQEFWKGLSELGSDNFVYGNPRMPSLLFSSGSFSGI